MLSLAKPQDPNMLQGPEAVSFFTKSGLPIDKLKEIWLIAAKTSNQYLTKEEFYIALRLIAYAQNGKTADENAIIFDVQVDLPRFD
jgi:nucleoside diphosphate kinase